MQLYNNLSKGYKRFIWAGYVLYLIWMNLLDGWDDIIDRYFKPITHSDLIDFGIMFLLYWLIVFIILWVADGFD